MDLTIVTHNAYWFQGWPSRWGQEEARAHPAILEALLDLYAELAPDVLCLQEVPSAQVLPMIQERLGMQGFYAPGAIREEYGSALLVRHLPAHFRDLSQEPVLPHRPFERTCIEAQIEGPGRALQTLGLHLSSDRYAPDRHGEPIRLAELEAAFGAVPAPDLVAGDFNARPESRVHAWMVERGYRDTGREMTAYITGEEPKRRRVDYVWLAHGGGLELVEHRVISGDSFRLKGTELSDHLPVVVRARWRTTDI